ncbi:MAG: transcriptional regulator, partial [Caldilineaceae bacterium]|nr:transcriptional regulator [Caldilineaceae bacterium]
REILQLLRIQPLAVGAIADHFPVSRPAISKHLRILHEAGLVAYQAEGASNIFHLQPARFQVLRHYLESFWTEALTNFQQVAVAQTNTEKHQSGT